MDCKDWNDEWVAHLYGELDTEQEQLLERHLAECAACTGTLEQLREARAALQASMPAVPQAPRVVVLQPPRAWAHAWAFAAGLACAASLFGMGLLMRPALPLPASTQSATSEPVSAEPVALSHEDLLRLGEQVRAFDDRLARIESGPAGTAGTGDTPAARMVTRAQFQQEIDQVQRRLDRERAQDLLILLEAMTAAEIRTGSWIDQTHEAINYLASRQDASLSEQ